MFLGLRLVQHYNSESDSLRYTKFGARLTRVSIRVYGPNISVRFFDGLIELEVRVSNHRSGTIRHTKILPYGTYEQ